MQCERNLSQKLDVFPLRRLKGQNMDLMEKRSILNALENQLYLHEEKDFVELFPGGEAPKMLSSRTFDRKRKRLLFRVLTHR